MPTKNKIINTAQYSELDKRERLGTLNVLVADRDHRTASLMQRILFSFGFRSMDVTTNGESAMTLLRSRPYDLIITEWNLVPIDGVTLVKAIRQAKEDARIRRDIPIIMLTARTDVESVQIARDAGITEYVAKPFSAKTISNRIIRVIDAPRNFVEVDGYVGPCRRRRGEPPPGVADRRVRDVAKMLPGQSLQQQLGRFTAADILNDVTVEQAQAELMKAQSEFVDWASENILRLEETFADLKARPHNRDARRALLDAAYSVRAQAGIFGYPLGAEIATSMVQYVDKHRNFTKDNLTVISKHIDTLTVIFKQQLKAASDEVATEMLGSLRKLIARLG